MTTDPQFDDDDEALKWILAMFAIVVAFVFGLMVGLEQ